MRRAQLLFFLLITFLGLAAQPGSVSQAEVDAAKRFIEAKQAVLLGNLDEAAERFKKMIDDDPDNDVLHYEMGRIDYVRERYDDAVTSLEKAYELKPELAYAGLLGELYESTGQYKKGAELFGDLARLRSSNDLLLQQALFYVRAQEIDRAIDIYDRLEKEMGISPELSRRKHALYLGQGDQKRAEKELKALIEAFPDQLEYRHLLAGYYTSQNDKGKARATYQEILEIEPADVKAQLALEGDVQPGNLTSGGNNDKLMTLLRRSDVDLDIKIGKLLPLVQAVANTGDVATADEGLVLVNELARVHPTDAKPAAMMGDLYFHSGRLAEAATAYRRTLELDDTVYPVWEQYLHALYLDNQLAELREQAETALEIYPNRPYVTFYFALGEAGKGDFASAESLMQEAVFIFGAASPEAGNMARTYQETIQALGQGQLPTPIALPVGEGPLSAYLRARAAYEAGNYQEAMDLLRTADSDRNTNALHLELLGDAILKTSGDKAAAAAAYRRAREAGSESRGLTKKINETKS